MIYCVLQWGRVVESQFISHRKWELHPQQLHRQSVQQVSWTHTLWKSPLSIGLECAYSTSWHHTHGQVVCGVCSSDIVVIPPEAVMSVLVSVEWAQLGTVWSDYQFGVVLYHNDPEHSLITWCSDSTYYFSISSVTHLCVCSCRWQFVGLSKQKSEELLMLPHNQPGSFLIRESETYPGTCVLMLVTLLALLFFYDLLSHLPLSATNDYFDNWLI